MSPLISLHFQIIYLISKMELILIFYFSLSKFHVFRIKSLKNKNTKHPAIGRDCPNQITAGVVDGDHVVAGRVTLRLVFQVSLQGEQLHLDSAQLLAMEICNR
jgi:hypothetical protein